MSRVLILQTFMAAAPPQPTLVLLGDSTLDNILWVPHPSSCVASLLRATGFNVLNYAADGFTTDDVLNGGKPILSSAARERAGDALPQTEESSRGVFEPLKHIEDLARKSGGSGSMAITVVLSVGGNDIRHILSNMKGVQATVMRLQANYAAILDRLLRLRPVVNTVICMQYRPCISQGSPYPPCTRSLSCLHAPSHPHSEMDRKFYGVYAAMATLPGCGSASSKLNSLMQRVHTLQPTHNQIITQKRYFPLGVCPHRRTCERSWPRGD